MKAVFFECPTGAAGNMLLAALIDAGADAKRIERQLKKLPVKGWSLKLAKVRKQGITALHLSVEQTPQPERHLSDIVRIIERAGFSEKVASRAILVFSALAKAEAKIHGTTVEKIHFHEVGAVDAIVDIVGTCLALEDLKVDEVHCSPLNLGHGRVKCDHGWLPVPAPATAILLKNVPVYQNEIAGELVTPTGAAILSTLSKGFGPMPQMTLASVGHGAGSKDLTAPNILRAMIGEMHSAQPLEQGLVMLETNIDDLNPQVYDYLMERLFAAGALDVYLTNVQMKKNRPGVLLSALVPIELEKEAADIIFSETTTLGIRRQAVERHVLGREMRTVATRYGKIRCKTAVLPSGDRRGAPEYEDCLAAAKKHGVALQAIMAEARKKLG